MQFREERGAKKKAVKDSFDRKFISLRGRLRPTKASNKPLENKQDKGGQTTQSTPQKQGQKFRRILADQINNDGEDGINDEMLKEIESEFGCEFIRAELDISGYSISKKTNFWRFLDFWSGKMDAVAFRRSGEDGLQVFVVDWKTTSKSDCRELDKWWTDATKFKTSLYQCLVYRELLRAHLNRSNLNADVGIILVPIHQNDPELSIPGLCVDFTRMDGMRLLDKLKDFQWVPVFDKSDFVPTIKLPCKLFKDSFDPADGVDQNTNILKGDTNLKYIFNDNATVADLCQELGLPFLKVEGKEKETIAQKDDKTSAIEIAAGQTNEELEEANQEKKASDGSRGETQALISIGSKKGMIEGAKVDRASKTKPGPP